MDSSGEGIAVVLLWPVTIGDASDGGGMLEALRVREDLDSFFIGFIFDGVPKRTKE